jgi:peptide/nickel transport system substrate-binding protein
MTASRCLTLVSLLAVALVGCASPPSGGGAQSGGSGSSTAPIQRTLVVISRGELPSLAAKPFAAFSGSLNPPVRLFNAGLDYIDELEVPHPYLQEALPQLNTDTWQIFPDGRMATTHRLKPSLTWHDGQPLRADDFAFAYRVYSTPELGQAGIKPTRQIEEVQTPDDRTVVIRWRQPFPDADRMDVDSSSLPPLPRHILEGPFQQLDAAGFSNHSFWTIDYVGAGPWRVEKWEPGAFIDATAFGGHALGRPKIDRLRLSFVPDPNTALANMLSGDAHFVADFVLGYDEGLTLEQSWGRDGGTVFFAPVLIRQSQVQHRPEYTKPAQMTDVRVRRALVHAFDTPGVLDVFTGGKGVITHTLTSPRIDYYPIVERGITKRDYDPRTAQRMLEDVGMTRGSDGFYQSPGGQPFKVDLWNTGGAVFARENTILTDSLRQAGIDATGQTLGPALLADAEKRALTAGLFTGGAGSDRLSEYSTEAIPKAENRWQGNNRGGWENAEYERLWQAYNSTIGQPERIQQIAQMERILNEEVGAIPHYFTVVVTAHVGSLRGPVARMTPDAPLAVHRTYLWEWVS